jgi:hypothetical protein
MTAPAPVSTWRNRITGSGEEAPDQLLANPANWRIHPKSQQDALAGALDAVGWVTARVAIDATERTGGHAAPRESLARVRLLVPRHQRR